MVMHKLIGTYQSNIEELLIDFCNEMQKLVLNSIDFSDNSDMVNAIKLL